MTIDATVILSLASSVGFLAASAVLVAFRRRAGLATSECFPLFIAVVLYAFASISNVLEHTGVTSYLDSAEDLAEVLFTLVIIYFVNTWRQGRITEDLRRQQRWFEGSVSSTSDGVITTDPHGRILQLNKPMEGLLDIRSGAVAGKPAAGVLVFVDRSTGLSTIYDPVGEALRGERASHGAHGDLLRSANGKVTSISEETTVIRGERGEVLGTIGIFRDMTEYDSMTEQLTQVHKMEAIGQLAGGVAHDLNNMLAGIMGAADLMREEMGGKDRARYGDLVTTILTASERAADLTANLLAFGRKSRYRTEPLAVNEMVRVTLAIAERTINKNVALEFHPAPEPLHVTGDPAQLQNCFLNLILNARDAMPDGGTVVATAYAMQFSQQSCDRSAFDLSPGDYACVEVSDDGPGIPEEFRTRVFEPFFTTKPEGKGTGLGLAAVYGTVVSHHGAIEMECPPTGGTTFRIFLPATTAEATAKPGPDHLNDDRGHGTILIIDDEAPVRDMARLALENAGYETMTAASGSEGLEAYRTNARTISAVIIDMIMPAMDGREVCIRLREINPDVRILMSSGYIRDETVPSEISAFLMKPYRIDELLGAVRNVLAGSPE